MDINVTILFQLALFLFVLVTVTNILLKPFMGILDERYRKIHGRKAEVDRLERLASENEAAYVARVREARNVARQERESLRATGNEEKRKLLADVRGEIARELSQTREQVAQSEVEARAQLTQENRALAGQLVAKLAGREVSQ
jgi:F-type H+-transporting ATPase subunit b